MDFAHALRNKSAHFNHHLLEGAANFFTTRIRHHAERAVLAAAFHHCQESLTAIDRGFGQAVKLLNLGEADIHYCVAAVRAVEHLREFMQRLRTEDHVDVGGTFADGGALLTGDTATHCDLEIRVDLL